MTNSSSNKRVNKNYGYYIYGKYAVFYNIRCPFLQALLFCSIGTQVEAEHVLNRLWIGEAEKSDSGNYSCTIPGHEAQDFPRAQVRVHVMDGKTQTTVADRSIRILNLICFFS